MVATTIPRRRALAFLSKANATAISAGVSVNGARLAASSTPYRRAWAWPQKPGAADASLRVPVANTGTVYLCGGAEELLGALPLANDAGPQELPADGDLHDVFLAVATANDGVAVAYCI